MIKIIPIYFKGVYGLKNVGDDIFLHVLIFISNKYLDSVPVFIADNIPSLKGKYFRIKGPRVLKKLSEILCCLFFKNIIVFGGSVTFDVHSRKSLFKYLSEVNMLNRKISILGNSLEYGEKCSSKTIRFLARTKYIGVRDYRSKMELDNFGIKSSFSFDPAILLTSVFTELNSSTTDNSLLGISLSYNKKGNIKAYFNKMLSFIHEIISLRPIRKIRFFVLNGTDRNDYDLNRDALRQLWKKGMKTEIINYSENTFEFCSKMAECHMICGSRLHSGIISYSLGIPFMLEEYHKKNTDFLNTIGHKFRLDLQDIQLSARNFEIIWDYKKVPDIVPKERFKEAFENSCIELTHMIKKIDV